MGRPSVIEKMQRPTVRRARAVSRHLCQSVREPVRSRWRGTGRGKVSGAPGALLSVRDPCCESCSDAGRAVELECAAERFDPVAESAHARAPALVGAAHTVVGDLDQHAGVLCDVNGNIVGSFDLN